MAETSIEWTDKTWNPTRGCKRVSPGCKNCYAERMAMRFSGPGMPYEGLVHMTSQGPKWTGIVREVPSMLDAPLHWKKPQRIFVDSMSDLFEEQVSDEFIDKVFAVMALCSRHTFQALTKRADRMQRYMSAPGLRVRIQNVVDDMEAWDGGFIPRDQSAPVIKQWPLPNVWLGVSVEDQERADERIPMLLETPAAVRFISAEPLLGPVDLRFHIYSEPTGNFRTHGAKRQFESARPADGGLHWVIAGGESGPGARPAHPDWHRGLRDQCAAAGLPFLFKQWGNWLPGDHFSAELSEADAALDESKFRSANLWDTTSSNWSFDPDPIEHDETTMFNVGKKAAGRLLDGRTWDGLPS
jgi:protein gp37